jgi:hypothetical protein
VEILYQIIVGSHSITGFYEKPNMGIACPEAD